MMHVFILPNYANAQVNTKEKDSLVFQYKMGLNGTLDKSLVTRLIFSSQNSFIVRNSWSNFEPILNYRYGYVQPLNRPRTDLENDAFVMLKSHFFYKHKIFPSVLAAYENSPNIRSLENRYFGGIGVGSYVVQSKNHFLQTMLYGLYENSDFKLVEYEVLRLMPFIKGNHYLEKQRIGVSYTLQYFFAMQDLENQRYRIVFRPYFRVAPKLDFSITYDLWYETIISGVQPKEISIILFGFNYSNF